MRVGQVSTLEISIYLAKAVSTCDEDLEKLILHKMNSFSIPIL